MLLPLQSGPRLLAAGERSHTDDDESDRDVEEQSAGFLPAGATLRRTYLRSTCDDEDEAHDQPKTSGPPGPTNDGAGFTCTLCGRRLANAGSRANHERACAQAVGNDPSRRRAPPGGQCRRNILCVRGLRHRGLGGPCRLVDPGVKAAEGAAVERRAERRERTGALPKRASGPVRNKPRAGTSGRSGKRKPKPRWQVSRSVATARCHHVTCATSLCHAILLRPRVPGLQDETEDEGLCASDDSGCVRAGTSCAAGGCEERRPVTKSTIPGRVGHAMVGRLIEVFWTADSDWQEGRVLSYNPNTGKHAPSRPFRSRKIFLYHPYPQASIPSSTCRTAHVSN